MNTVTLNNFTSDSDTVPQQLRTSPFVQNSEKSTCLDKTGFTQNYSFANISQNIMLQRTNRITTYKTGGLFPKVVTVIRLSILVST